jgi:hypothetical protein
VVHKCANSKCEIPFLYFRSGKIFQFPRPEKQGAESFWLCGDCSRELTLKWNESGQVVLALKEIMDSVAAESMRARVSTK